MSNSTQKFLSCAGVPSQLEADHVLNLKGLISAALDVYTFMRSSASGVPLVDVSAGVGVDEGHVIRAWLDIRLTPLLSSISRNFLTCLSNRNFSCSAYQTVVRELSQHFSGLDPFRQKWIYSFFMYPFLSRNTTSGCVDSEVSSEDWLLKNFGSFSVMAQVKDFSSINMLFSGALNGFMTAFRPVGSFVHNFVSLTQQKNLSGMRSATLMQAMINLTLAEIAAPFKHNLTEKQQDVFDPTDVHDWFTHVVSPILRRFLPADQTEIPYNLTAVFHNQFYIETGMASGVQNDSQHVCSVSVDDRTCALTDLVEHVSTILHCAASSNLTLTEDTLLEVLLHLSQNLNALLQQLSMTNFSSQNPAFSDILSQIADDAFTTQSLQDEAFVRFVSELSNNMFMMSSEGPQSVYQYFIFSFLSQKNASGGCPAESSIIWTTQNLAEFSQFATLIDIYHLNPDFNAIDALAVLSPRQTAELIVEDLPGLPKKSEIINVVFSYILISPEERGLLEMLEHLIMLAGQRGLECSSYQQIVQRLQESMLPQHMMRGIQEKIEQMKDMAPFDCFAPPPKKPLSCTSNQIIFRKLEQVLRTSAGDLESIIWISLYNFNSTAPAGCSLLPSVDECPLIPFNEAQVCGGVDRSSLQLQLNTADASSKFCDFSVQQYACTPVLNVSVENLVSVLECQSSADVVSSPDSWKLFLIRVSHVLDSALHMLSNTTMWWDGQSGSVILDVLRELRLDRLTDDGVIAKQFAKLLRPFLPLASRAFLHVSVFDAGFLRMNDVQQQMTVKEFILPIIQRQTRESACVSSNSSLWISTNLGQFSSLLTLDQLITLNPQIKLSNMSCDSYRVIFHRLDHLLISVSVSLETVILRKRTALLKSVPPGCLIYSGKCDITPVNGELLFLILNQSSASAAVCSSLSLSQKRQRATMSTALLCRCISARLLTAVSCLTDLSSEDLETVLSCGFRGNDSVSDETLKLFVQKVNPVLGLALDQLNVTRLNKSRLSVSFLNMIGEVTLSTFSSSSLTDDSFVQRWFNGRLRPFLPHSSEAFLSCLSTRDFSCDTYRTVVNSFSQSSELMSADTQENVYVDFINIFLSLNNTKGCVTGTKNTSDWLIRNFGDFRVFSTISSLQTLYPSFSVMDTFSLMSIRQLVEVSSTPGLLSTSADVNQLLSNIPTNQLTEFYKPLSLSLQSQGVSLSAAVREEFLQQVFVRVNLTSASDVDLQLWIQNILPPVELLNSSSSSFTPATQDEVYHQILNSLQGSGPLRCYGNQSYLSFLQSSFMGFQFPNLRLFLSLMPPARVPELMSSMSPAEISIILNRPDAVDDVTKVCQLLYAYPKTPQYLQTEPVGSEVLGRQVLSCVWSQVLRVENRSEVDWWFDQLLVRYLPFLTAQLIDPDVMRNASCLSFSKFVSVMGQYNFSAVGFSPRDIYSNIQIYLNTTSTPKCYDPSHPELNSTAWFANYIYTFMSFITLDDLTLLYGSLQLQPFTVNLDNLKLFDLLSVPDNVTEFYVTLLFQQDPSFSAFYLPMKFRCLAPPTSFSNLNVEQLKTISPGVSAALSSNPQVLSVESITVLGQSCVGLSTTQLSGAGGGVLLDSLLVLSSVIGWNQDQAMTIIQSLLSSGLYVAVGSLILGVSSSTIMSLSGNELLASLQSAPFVTHVSSAPVIVQQTMVNQIIAINSSSDFIVNNVPAVMATEIPRIYLVDLSPAAVESINMKTWKHEQAVMLFEIVAERISEANNISFQVLQGFTCTGVQSFSTFQINNLIRGCRQRNNTTIILQESQLTCMYYYIKSSNLHAFTQYPADVLLYYNYSQVESSQCRSYFSALGNAKFSVLSSMLSFKQQTLFNNARDCLVCLYTQHTHS
ncbi:hypothetical protein E1301_Tti023053 [Triplophysa tibetana]|uniref:Uncharacterized protein n=1 Tax=Triplophysa tibetana TaxID=1572043 RepID=A0A5A9PL09_9TELE|nr:hypothetical protein E1301_Tti023053 [Triplophysa tibetana]